MRVVVALAGPAMILAVSAGCQKSAPPPPAKAPPAGPVATILPPAGSAAASAEPAHVQLPRSPDTPVRPTGKPLDAATLGRLAHVEFADFEREEQAPPTGMVRFRHITRSRPRLAVTIVIGPCSAQHACPAMDLASWNARRDQLRGELPRELRERADTRFEIGAREIAGAPAIYTYQLGYAGGADERDQPSADYSDSYVLYYNDKVNQIQVMAHYVDDAVGGIPQLLAIAPPEDLEKLAVAFASYYLRAWP